MAFENSTTPESERTLSTDLSPNKELASVELTTAQSQVNSINNHALHPSSTRTSATKHDLEGRTQTDGRASIGSEARPDSASTTTSSSSHENPKKDLGFWMIMLTLAMCMFLSALDLTAVSTVLPTIALELHSENFSWVGSSYTLSSTAFLPVFGGLAQTFGRKINMLVSVVIFAVGSALCGSAHSMTQMIIGRTIQGVGGGGILAMSEIVVADLVPLSERGVFMGILGTVWALASAVGPISGGALASSNWRWLFYLNLPIAGISIALVLVFMRLKVPEGSLNAKLKRIDWLGSTLFVISSTLIILGLTFGGDTFPWKSAGTLAPLLIGIAFLPAFIYVEMKHVEHPILPFELFNRTTAVGYFTTFIHGIIVMAIVYFLPTWFMAVKGQSPVRSGISLFPVSFLVAPFAMAAGVVVAITQKYKLVNILGWVFCVAGAGLLAIIKAESATGLAIGLEAPVSIGLGLLYSGTTFPVLAPLPPSRSAAAMSFHAFSRSFGQVIGITVGTTVLSNELAKKLPQAFLQSLHGGAAAAYAQIREFKDLPEPIRSQLRSAYSDSLRPIWYVMMAFAAVALLVSVFMKGMALNATTDEAWGIQEKAPRTGDVEKA